MSTPVSADALLRRRRKYKIIQKYNPKLKYSMDKVKLIDRKKNVIK